MIKRTRSHVIDTLAVREIISTLPADWLIRSMEERDYGIDLTLEIFDGENPTGKVALIQVKGKEKAFTNPIKLSFPTKTIEYSLLFQEPFFIFHTSITDKKTYFVWAQKYAHTRLHIDSPNWRSQGTATIYFPPENVLNGNNKKIHDIMSIYIARSEGLEFLAAFEWFKMHWEAFNHGNGNASILDACLANLQQIKSCKEFLSVHMKEDMEIDFVEIQNCIDSLKESFIHENDGIDSIHDWTNSVDNQLELLTVLKIVFLNHSDLDQFLVEKSDSTPY